MICILPISLLEFLAEEEKIVDSRVSGTCIGEDSEALAPTPLI